MKVGILQFDVSHQKEENFKVIISALKKKNAELLVLPELSLCGYLFETRDDLRNSSELVPVGPSTQRMIHLSKEFSCTIVFGLAELENDKIYNTAIVVSRGRYIGKYRKIHLSDFEKKYFDRGSENTVFDIDGIKIGVQICFDLWFPEISRKQILMGADILCALGNFGGDTTYHISQIRAIENLTPLVLCNRIGNETIPELNADFLGKSVIYDAHGERLFIDKKGKQYFKCCEVSLLQKHSNIICSNFDEEIKFHY